VQRWQLLRPVVEDGMPLTAVAREHSVPVRTAQRWLTRWPGRLDDGSTTSCWSLTRRHDHGHRVWVV